MATNVPPEYQASHPLSTHREGRAAEWARDNGRVLGVVGAALVVALVGGWAWRSSEGAKSQRAEQALYVAQASASQAGPAQAERALRDVANRYGGTAGGAQAQLLLAQALYDGGRYQEGLNVLTRTKPPAEFADAFRLLTAGGYEGLGRGRDAAKLYEELAGSKDVVPRRRDELRSAAARAYQLANDRAAATRLWQQVASEGSGPVVDEARVRLGELKSNS